MPSGLKRFQQAGDLHFITFSCYRREPLLGTPSARRVFELTLERVRVWYRFCVTGYVVMPEHVHLLVSGPDRGMLAVALQMLKQVSAHELRQFTQGKAFWLARYYDFNIRLFEGWWPIPKTGNGAAIDTISPERRAL